MSAQKTGIDQGGKNDRISLYKGIGTATTTTAAAAAADAARRRKRVGVEVALVRPERVAHAAFFFFFQMVRPGWSSGFRDVDPISFVSQGSCLRRLHRPGNSSQGKGSNSSSSSSSSSKGNRGWPGQRNSSARPRLRPCVSRGCTWCTCWCWARCWSLRC